jgi:succinate dehydrogenase / fumarate reductase iron-sulfur subunit
MSDKKTFSIKLKVWRQPSNAASGELVSYDLHDVSPDSSFLEMLDQLNETLIAQGQEPVAFEHDCREGICGSCSMMINGEAHGPVKKVTACQLHMRSFHEGQEVVVEPWRAAAFPIRKDLVVNRSAFDKIIQAGGYISVNTGAAVDANAVPIRKDDADAAFDYATCIGCGACVAACPNGSGMLFTSAKVSHLGLLAQGQPERYSRVLNMVKTHDELMFGSCTNHGECQEACPKGISIASIAQLNRDFLKASLVASRENGDEIKAQ